ncbi:hypothetical protein ACRALDRAFT_209500 [Sodiomyces alcalophilus JCM 7366]|uniref:uncharacterized protein n=1 Tax=Sodiomyces alcalophilus JCM 7366 TaxID=591952 RepID=UPI0039B577CF
MFGGCRQHMSHLSAEEIKQMEAEANFTIQQVLVSAVMLYLCMSFVTLDRLLATPADLDPFSTLAPFAINALQLIATIQWSVGIMWDAKEQEFFAICETRPVYNIL